MLSWPRHGIDRPDKTPVHVLCCEAWKKHECVIAGMKNFSRVWLSSSSNHMTSNIVDHTTSEHCMAMAQVRTDVVRASNLPITSYFSIVQIGPPHVELWTSTVSGCQWLSKLLLKSENDEPSSFYENVPVQEMSKKKASQEDNEEVLVVQVYAYLTERRYPAECDKTRSEWFARKPRDLWLETESSTTSYWRRTR